MGAGTEEQCRAPRQTSSEYCFFHDAAAQAHRELLARLEKLPLQTSGELHEFLAETVKAVADKRLDPQQAYAIGWLVRLLRENLAQVAEEHGRHQSGGYVGWTPEQVQEQAWRELEAEDEVEEETEEADNASS
ncbi:MAG: hypothetical protein ACE5HL_12440 [Terriglobia bacterium]